MATTRRLPAKLSNLRINAPPPNSQIALVQGESSACSSADDDSSDSSPSKPRPSRNMKKLSLTLPSSSSLALQIPTESQSAVSPTAAARKLRRPSVMSLPATTNPTPNSVLHRKEEDGTEATAPYTGGPVQIIPGVWLGSEDNARDWTGLLERGIKSVLNVAKEVANPLDVNQLQPHLRAVASTPNFNKTNFSSQKIDDPTYVPSNPVTGRPPMHYLKLQWSHGQQDLVQSGFLDAMAFTDAALQRGDGVLIHCQCGISRSATLVIALVMRAAAEQSPSVPPDVWALKGMQGAYSYVKEKSACIGPNMSLIYQLLDYEKTLNKVGNSTSSPLPAEPDSPSVADEEEWSRQRKLFEETSRSNDDDEEDDRESSAIRQEAEALDKAMEDRIVARKSSTSSVNSTNSGVGMGAAWRSRYGQHPRKRAGSVASNMTTGSVLSEDLVEEAEEEELLGVGGGFDTEGSTSSTTTSPEDDVDEGHAQHVIVPPRIPHRYGSLGSKAMPSAPVWKTSFKLAAPPATAARSTFNIPPPPKTAVRSSFNLPPVPLSAGKGKRRPAPIGILPPVPSSPIAIVVDSPTSSANHTPAQSLPVAEPTKSIVSLNPTPQRATSLSLPPVRARTKSGKLPPPLHLRKNLTGNTASKATNLTILDSSLALSTPSQTLFVFPPSPTSTLATTSRTPSTMTLSNAPLPFPSLSTPRVSSFRAQGRTRSFIGLGSVPTPTTAFSKVDARGYVGLQ